MGQCVSAPPNEAAIVSGCYGTRIVVGQTTYALWLCDRVDRMPLQMYTLNVTSHEAETSKGVRVNVNSVAQVKVKAFQRDYDLQDPSIEQPTPQDLERQKKEEEKLDRTSILEASQNFMGSTEQEIMAAIQRTLEGHQREILGTLTVESLYKNKAELTGKVRTHVVDDLKKMGFVLISFSITSIADADGYMEALGQEQTALVKRQAEEGMSKNQNAARENVQNNVTKATIEVNRAKEQEAESERDLALKRAAYERETAVAEAEAQSAHPIEMARQKQFIVKEQLQQEVVEEEMRFVISEKNVNREKMMQQGQAEAKLLAQEKHAESVKVDASAQGEKIRKLGQADADVIRLKGEAEAEILLKKGEAEAKVLREKAEAFKQYGDAAITQMVVEQLPKIAEAIAKPLSKTDKMVFVSHDGSAASGLTGDMTKIIAQVPHLVKGLSGFDLVQAAERMSGKQAQFQSQQQDVATEEL